MLPYALVVEEAAALADVRTTSTTHHSMRHEARWWFCRFGLGAWPRKTNSTLRTKLGLLNRLQGAPESWQHCCVFYVCISHCFSVRASVPVVLSPRSPPVRGSFPLMAWVWLGKLEVGAGMVGVRMKGEAGVERVIRQLSVRNWGEAWSIGWWPAGTFGQCQGPQYDFGTHMTIFVHFAFGRPSQLYNQTMSDQYIIKTCAHISHDTHWSTRVHARNI